jgi:transglutaminase-like putative cysteine protease
MSTIRRITISWLAFAGLLSLSLSGHSAPERGSEKSREFLFAYEATVKGLRAEQSARIWLPVPPSNEEQTVTIVEKQLPAKEQIAKETKYGNEILYLEGKADGEGKIRLAVTYSVRRKEVKADLDATVRAKEDLNQFLKPDAKVPVGGKPLTLLADRTLPRDQLELGRLLYDVVNSHMRYSMEGTGWGRGDAEWACDSRYGNCSDFHSLFISLARSQKIPAKFEMGFSVPEKHGTGEIPRYHCWAWFKPKGKGWVPVDISEANKHPNMKEYYFGNLTENRVAFSIGRDLILVPKQDGPPLNCFVYPYVEVDGTAYPDGKIERRFTYRDLNGAK